MSSNTQSLTADQSDSYQLPEIAAPEGTNPDVVAYMDAPAGDHLMEIYDFDIFADQTFRIKSEQFILDQLRPKMRIVEGRPHAGAGIMDFLPMPNGPMHVTLANRWTQFLKRCGFDIPQGRLAPAGFHPKQLIGRRLLVKVEHSTGSDGELKYKDNRDPRMGVKFFGYGYAHEADSPTFQAASGAVTVPQNRPATAPPKKSPPPVAAAAGADFDL